MSRSESETGWRTDYQGMKQERLTQVLVASCPLEDPREFWASSEEVEVEVEKVEVEKVEVEEVEVEEVVCLDLYEVLPMPCDPGPQGQYIQPRVAQTSKISGSSPLRDLCSNRSSLPFLQKMTRRFPRGRG